MHLPSRSTLHSIALVLAVVMMGLTIECRDSFYSAGGLVLLSISLLLAGIAALGRGTDKNSPINDSPSVVKKPYGACSHGGSVVEIIASLALAVQFGVLLWVWPPGYAMSAAGDMQRGFFLTVMLAGVVLAGAGILNLTPVRKFWLPGLVVLQMVLGGWVIRASPWPQIDVWIFQQRAAAELLAGHNPYLPGAYPNIYPTTNEYGPGLADGRELRFGFPYPPISLLLSTAGYAVTDDHRYSQVLAIAVAALFMAYAHCRRESRLFIAPRITPFSGLACEAFTPPEDQTRDHPELSPAVSLNGAYFVTARKPLASEAAKRGDSTILASLAAALFLFTPRVFYVIGQAWTEPFSIMLLAGTMFCACRGSKLLPVALGLFLASKQYSLFAIPLTFLLLPHPWTYRRWFFLLIQAGIIVLLVNLPFAAWNFPAFYKSIVTVHTLSPFKPMSLTFLALFPDGSGEKISGIAPVITAAIAIGLCARWAPRTPSGFCTAVGFVYLAMFSFSKQGAANYYFFVIGALCCGLAAMGVRVVGRGMTPPERISP